MGWTALPDNSDHPRSRGVYKWDVQPGDLVTGSSPLARGLLPPFHVTNITPRIIPARAGFTGELFIEAEGARDHPRSRGVYGEH